MPANNYLNDIPLRSIRNTVYRLNEYCNVANADSEFVRPNITLIISGHAVSGSFYKFGSDNNIEYIFLHLANDDSLAVIKLTEVSVLYINNLKQVAHILSHNELSYSVNDEPIGNLILNRELKAQAELINAHLECNMAFTYDNEKKLEANQNILKIAKIVAEVFKEMDNADFIKEAVSGLSEIKIINSDKNTETIKKQNKQIIISKNLTEALNFSFKNEVTIGLNNLL